MDAWKERTDVSPFIILMRTREGGEREKKQTTNRLKTQSKIRH